MIKRLYFLSDTFNNLFILRLHLNKCLVSTLFMILNTNNLMFNIVCPLFPLNVSNNKVKYFNGIRTVVVGDRAWSVSFKYVQPTQVKN